MAVDALSVATRAGPGQAPGAELPLVRLPALIEIGVGIPGIFGPDAEEIQSATPTLRTGDNPRNVG